MSRNWNRLQAEICAFFANIAKECSICAELCKDIGEENHSSACKGDMNLPRQIDSRLSSRLSSRFQSASLCHENLLDNNLNATKNHLEINLQFLNQFFGFDPLKKYLNIFFPLLPFTDFYGFKM